MSRGGHKQSISAQVRALLAARGWSLSDLAAKVGVKRGGAVLNLLCGNNPSDRTRYRCELVLGTVPIWHSKEELAARSITSAWFDADVYFMARRDLVVLARRHLRANGFDAGTRSAKEILHRLEAIATGGIKKFPQEAVRGRTKAYFGQDVYGMNRDALDCFARQHLRAAGFPSRIRPMGRLLETLEQIAAKGMKETTGGEGA